MLVGDKFHSYQKRSRSVLGVSCGPSGWVFATWSYVHPDGYELTVSDSNGTTLGSIGLATQLDTDSWTDDFDFGALSGRQRGIEWHASGGHVAVAESGKVFVFGIRWAFAATSTEFISFERAGEVFYARQGIATDPDGTSRMDNVGDELQATVTLLRQSMCVGATALSVSQTLLGSTERARGGRAVDVVLGSLLIGTDEGAILLVEWDDSAAAMEVHNDAHRSGGDGGGDGAAAGASAMPAVVLVPAQAATAEDRDLLRPWQRGSYTLSSAASALSHSPSPIHQSDAAPRDGGVLAPVIDIGDASHDAVAEAVGYGQAAGQIDDHIGVARPYAKDSTVVCAPSSVQTLSFDDKSRTLVAVYGDGSFCVTIIRTLGEDSSPSCSWPFRLHNATTVALNVVCTARLHPVLRVAYPLYPSASVAGNADPRPAVYELGAAAAHRSSSFVTEQDVRALLDLTPSLLRKVCRMRSLVTGRAEDEICRVLGAELVRGADGLQILCLVQSRHLPAHTFAVSAAHRKEPGGRAEAGSGDDEEAGERYESFSLLLLAVIAQEGGGGVALECLQSACVERAGPGDGVCQSRLLEVVRVPDRDGAAVLVLHSDGRITCRALDRLSSALFSVQTQPSPDPEESVVASGSGSGSPGGLALVNATVCTGSIIVSRWSPQPVAGVELAEPSAVSAPCSRLLHIPLFVSLSGGLFPSRASGMFVDLAEGFVVQPVADTEQRHSQPMSRAVAGAEVFGRFSAPSRLWQLPLPRALLRSVHRYRLACGATPQHCPNIHGGLVVAFSELSHGGDAGGHGERYLAAAAGGGKVGRHALQAQRKPTGELQLWVYNCRTRRWRAVSLSVGAPGSSAQVLRLEFSALPERSASQDSLSRAQEGLRASGRRRSSEDLLVSPRSASADDWGKNTAPLLPLPVRESPKANGRSVVSPRSHLGGDPSAVLSLAWFGTHSLLLLTMRRSACCLEIVSRELTKPTTSAGAPAPATHRLLLLPPGYQPTNMHVMLHPGTTERCSVVLFDGATLLCYHIAATMRTAQGTPAGVAPAQVAEYGVEEGWDASIAALVPSQTGWTGTEEFGSPLTENPPRGAGTERPSVALPLREALPFLQTTAFHGSQEARFQTEDSSLPMVAMLLLDRKGSVWYADPEQGTFLPVSAGPVATLSHLEMPDLTRWGPCQTEQAEWRPHTGSGFLLHHIPHRSAQANSRLLYIFQKTSLAQHLSPAGAALVERCTLQRSTLWLPVTWSSASASRSASCSDADLCVPDVEQHPGATGATAADWAVRGLSAGQQALYSAVALSLPPLPPHAQPLLVARDGTCTLLTRRNLDITSRPGSRALPAGAPQVMFLSLPSEAVVAAMESEWGEGGLAVTVEGSRRPPAHAVRLLMRALVAGWIREARLRVSGTGHLVAYLELLIHRWAESSGFTHEHPQYVHLTQVLADTDPALLCELVSRLGRKLEPSVSHKLFPLAVSVESNRLSVVPLYEACRAAGHVDHAARTLSLACDAVGGTAGHISTVASLFIALDYLSDSAAASSLRCFAECLRFCSRLERTLFEHSVSIFGTTSGGASVLDDSYRRTVKGRALALISAHAAAHGGPAGSPLGEAAQRTPSTEASANPKLAEPAPPAPAPAGRFYLGMGVNWVLAKAVQSFLPQTERSQAPSDSSSKGARSARSYVGRGQGVTHPLLPALSIPNPSFADPEMGTIKGSLQSLILGPPVELSPPCSAIAAVEARVGSQELNAFLTPRGAQGHPDTSITVLSLALIFEELFRCSSHYCNAAILMHTVQQDPSLFSTVRYIASSSSPPLGSTLQSDIPASERVRRVLFSFGLSKAVSRALDVPAMLASSILPQSLRRLVGADTSHLPAPSPLSTHVPNSTRSAFSRVGSWSVPGSAKSALPSTPPLTAVRKVPPLLHADYFELAAADPVPRAAAGGGLTLISLLKALALALLFVHDRAAAGLLLTALAPFLPQVDPDLHAALRDLPVPAATAAATQTIGEEGSGQEQEISTDNAQESLVLWNLSPGQLRGVVDALCSDT